MFQVEMQCLIVHWVIFSGIYLACRENVAHKRNIYGPTGRLSRSETENILNTTLAREK